MVASNPAAPTGGISFLPTADSKLETLTVYIFFTIVLPSGYDIALLVCWDTARCEADAFPGGGRMIVPGPLFKRSVAVQPDNWYPFRSYLKNAFWPNLQPSLKLRLINSVGR